MKLIIKLSIFTLFFTKIATACEFQEIADDKISYMGFINAEIGWIRFQCPHHQEFSLARCGCFNPLGNSAGGQVWLFLTFIFYYWWTLLKRLFNCKFTSMKPLSKNRKPIIISLIKVRKWKYFSLTNKKKTTWVQRIISIW